MFSGLLARYFALFDHFLYVGDDKGDFHFSKGVYPLDRFS